MPWDMMQTAYLACALWSSSDDAGEPLDESGREMHPETVARLRADVATFATAHVALLDHARAAGMSDEQIGHDFWLTRNGHGAGFWDRGLGALGDELTAACKPYGSCNLYVGDDGFIHAF